MDEIEKYLKEVDMLHSAGNEVVVLKMRMKSLEAERKDFDERIAITLDKYHAAIKIFDNLVNNFCRGLNSRESSKREIREINGRFP